MPLSDGVRDSAIVRPSRSPRNGVDSEDFWVDEVPFDPSILRERGIHFGTVTPPDVGQRPTFDPELSILWDLTTLTAAHSACCPTAVPKWIPPLPDVGGAD